MHAEVREGAAYFKQVLLAAGMVAFEPDFMQQNHQCLPAFRSRPSIPHDSRGLARQRFDFQLTHGESRVCRSAVGAMSTWLEGMAGAALAIEPPVPVQFCMVSEQPSLLFNGLFVA